MIHIRCTCHSGPVCHQTWTGSFHLNEAQKAMLTKDKASRTRLPALRCKVGIWLGSPRQWWRLDAACTIPKHSDQKQSRHASRACSRGAGPVSRRGATSALNSCQARISLTGWQAQHLPSWSYEKHRLSWPLRRQTVGRCKDAKEKVQSL